MIESAAEYLAMNCRLIKFNKFSISLYHDYPTLVVASSKKYGAEKEAQKAAKGLYMSKGACNGCTFYGTCLPVPEGVEDWPDTGIFCAALVTTLDP